MGWLTEWFTHLVSVALEAVTCASLPVLVALFLVTTLTEMGVPFPFVQDTVLFYIGYNTGSIPPRAFAIMLAMFLGRVFGAGIIYALARLTGGGFTSWLERRFPKVYARLDGLKACWADEKANHRLKSFLSPKFMVGVTVCILRLTPGLLTAVTVAAGLIRLRFDVFVLGIFLASLAADGVLLVSGLLAGLGVQWLGIVPSWWLFLILLLVVVVSLWLFQMFVSRRRNRRLTVD